MKAVRTSWTGPVEDAPIAREAPATTARPRRSRARSQDVYEELFELAPDAYLFTALQERVDALGGRLRVESGPGAGTRVRVTVPFHDPSLPCES
jgi:hypothetical protein